MVMSLRFTWGFFASFLAFFALVTPPAKLITNISIMENMIDVKIKTDFTDGSNPKATIEKIGKNILYIWSLRERISFLLLCDMIISINKKIPTMMLIVQFLFDKSNQRK